MPGFSGAALTGSRRRSPIGRWSWPPALPDPVPVTRRTGGTPAPVTRSRRVYDAALRTEVEATEVARSAMAPGMEAPGPAIITEAETSTIVTCAFRAIAQDDGCLLLIRKDMP